MGFVCVCQAVFARCECLSSSRFVLRLLCLRQRCGRHKKTIDVAVQNVLLIALRWLQGCQNECQQVVVRAGRVDASAIRY